MIFDPDLGSQYNFVPVFSSSKIQCYSKAALTCGVNLKAGCFILGSSVDIDTHRHSTVHTIQSSTPARIRLTLSYDVTPFSHCLLVHGFHQLPNL